MVASDPLEPGEQFWSSKASSNPVARVPQMTVQKWKMAGYHFWEFYCRYSPVPGIGSRMLLGTFLGSGVARDHQGTLFGHYDIECLLETCQASPLVMWGSLGDSLPTLVAAN